MSEDEEILQRLGWREWIDLPDIAPEPIKAKIDTGARSSSLHSKSIEVFEREGQTWVTFEVVPRQKNDAVVAKATMPVHDFRMVRSSSGEAVERIVIRTPIRLGGDEWEVDLTLFDRAQMGFRMLVGREAIRKRFVVDPGASYLWGQPEAFVNEEDDEDTIWEREPS